MHFVTIGGHCCARFIHVCGGWVGAAGGKNHVDSCLQARLILKYGCGGVAGVGAGDSNPHLHFHTSLTLRFCTSLDMM